MEHFVLDKEAAKTSSDVSLILSTMDQLRNNPRVYRTRVVFSGGKVVVLATTSKDIYLGLGAFEFHVQQALVRIIEKTYREQGHKQFLLSIENKGRDALLVTAVQDGNTVSYTLSAAH